MTEKVCNCCKQNKHVSEFYMGSIDKYGRAYPKSICKVCSRNTDKRVKNPGRNYHYLELQKQNLKFCPSCKQIKNFFKRPECQSCESKRIADYKNTEKGKKIFRKINLKYHLGYVDEEIIKIYNLQKEIKNLLLINFDNKVFNSTNSFAKYLYETYNIKQSRTNQRMSRYKCTPEECLLSTNDLKRVRKL